ncbi:MAG: hypothetical protein ACXAEN_24110, partial [Candidatus Thorarchaeota archaeon]
MTKEPDVKVTELNYPEMPFCVNFYGVTKTGWNCQYTVRAFSEGELVQEQTNLIKKLEGWGVSPKAIGKQPEGNG